MTDRVPSPKKQHYCAVIDVDSVNPLTSKLAGEVIVKLSKDPACVVTHNMWDAFHLSRTGMGVVHVHFQTPVEKGILLTHIMPTSERTYTPETFPFPWSPSARHIIGGARATLPENLRDYLYPFAE